MSQSFLLRGARQLLTLRGPSSARRGAALQDLGIIEDGSVLIRDGVIASLGSTRRIENLKAARNAQEIPIEGRIITPGFIDANLHLSLRRSEDSNRPKRLADFYEDTLSLMRSCLQHGTITADAEVSADGRDFHSDIAVLRTVAKIGKSPVRAVRTWRVASQANSTLSGDGRATLDVLLRRNLIDSLAVAPQHSSDFDMDMMVAARTAGLPIKMLWLGESKGAFADLLRQLNPHSVTAGSFSMQMSIALAVARLGLTPEEAWSAATVNAAYAAGYGDITGTLEVGKQADLLILNVADYREIPRQFGLNHVAMVFRDGMMVLNRTRWRPPSEQPADRVRS